MTPAATSNVPGLSGAGPYEPGVSGSGTMGSMTMDSGSDPDSGAMLADGSWLAGLAMGDSARAHIPSSHFASAALSLLLFSFVYL